MPQSLSHLIVHQGDSLGNVFPGLKPMGYSVFAPSGDAKCPNCRLRLSEEELRKLSAASEA